MREIEESVDSLRGETAELARALTLQAKVGRMGGFGTLIKDLETDTTRLSESINEISGLRRLTCLDT
jgi:hypothetical protein